MPKKITAVLGDFYHNKNLAVQSLEKAVNMLGAHEKVHLTYLTVNELTKNLQEKPDVVILFAENRLNPEDEQINTWMNDHIAVEIKDYVKNGGSWMAWHSGLASYEKIEDYTELLKGYFIHHPEEHQLVQYTAEVNTNIINPDLSFEFIDEHYFVHVKEDETNIYLRSSSVDGKSIAGWQHTYGSGKVTCLTPAHLEEGLLNVTFLKLLSEQIKWCLR